MAGKMIGFLKMIGRKTAKLTVEEDLKYVRGKLSVKVAFLKRQTAVSRGKLSGRGSDWFFRIGGKDGKIDS